MRKPHLLETYRALVRTKLYPKLTRRAEELKRDGRYPFEGRWLSQAEIIFRREELRKRDREALGDLMVVFGLGWAGAALMIFALVVLL